MTALSVLYDSVIPVVNAPAPTVLRHTQRVAVDFYARSLAWRHTTSITTENVTAEYDVEMPELSDVTLVAEKLFAATVDGAHLVVSALPDLKRVRPDWRMAAGTPTWVILLPENKVRLSPIPTGASSVSLDIAVRPTRATTDLPDALYERHEPALLAGTLAHLTSEQGKEYSNLEAAMRYQELYERRLMSARARAAGRRNRTPAEFV